MTGSLVDLSKEFKNGYKWDDLTSYFEENVRGGLWGGFKTIDISLDGEVIVMGGSNLPGDGGFYGYTPAGEIHIFNLIEGQLTKIGQINGEEGRDTNIWEGFVDVDEQIGSQFSLSGNGKVLAVIGRGANNPSTGEKDDARISIYKISEKGWSKTATIWSSDYVNISNPLDIELNYDGDLIYITNGNVGGWVDVFINNDNDWHKFTHSLGESYDFSTDFKDDIHRVNTSEIEISGDGKTLAIKGNSVPSWNYFNSGNYYETRLNGVKVYRIENPNISAIGSKDFGFELDFKELGQTIDSLYFEKYGSAPYKTENDPNFNLSSVWRTDFVLSNDGNRLAISETGLSGYGIAETTRVFQLENENWVEMNYEDQISYSDNLSFSSDGEILISGNIAYKINNEKWEQIGNTIEPTSFENSRFNSLESVLDGGKGSSKISPNGEYAAVLVQGYANNLNYETFYYESDSSSYAYPSALYLYNLLEADETNPSLSFSTPVDNATGVATDSNIVLNFSEAVDVETGNINIIKYSDDSTFEVIDVTSELVTGSGTTSITINPAADLEESTQYYVQIDDTAFDDSSSNSFAGITDKTTFSFITISSTSDSSSSSYNSSSSDSSSSNSSTTSTQITDGAKVAEVNSSYVSDPKGFSSISGSAPVTVTSYEIGKETTLDSIKDYDGNLHAGDTLDATASSYKYQGMLDVNGDGTFETIFTNKSSKRWVTGSVDSITGQIDFSDHGQGGTTRVVGIYIDPLVTSGEVEQFGPHDSQRRFQNDLKIDNLIAKTSGDYDGDGFQEVYWKTNDGTAYLRALMHADGNIQYANYQSEAQMSNYLTSKGYADVINDII